MWDACRQTTASFSQVHTCPCLHHLSAAEAKASYRRRGGQPLLVENDLKLARFLAGLHVSADFFGSSCIYWVSSPAAS